VTGACPSSLLTDRSVREHGFLPVDHEAGGGIAEEMALPVENPVTGSWPDPC
jgi:hypothetical protein